MQYYKNEFAGFYNWRIDNDDPVPLGSDHYGVPRYSITSQMWEYFRGQAPQPPLYP